MQLYEMQVNKTALFGTAPVRIPRGIIGAVVKLSFSAEWEGLTKTAVFRAGEVTKDVADIQDAVVIPAECTREEGELLQLGIYGVDAQGTVAIPTLWASIGRITEAADPSGDETTDPSLPVWAQVLEMVKQLEEQGVTQNEVEQAVKDFFGGQVPPGRATAEGGEIFNDYENNQALAPYATAEGYGTIAAGRYQHAQGKYNVGDSEKANIVGGGTSDTDRKNIYALDWDGNAEFAGDVYVGPNKEVLAKRSETAPAGFGLGEWRGRVGVTDANEMLFNGWYHCDNVANTPFTHGWMFVVARDVSWVKQEFYSALHDTAPTLIRFKQVGVWGEWEYVNPSMHSGIEYRTEERFKGKAVYTKLIAYGALPSSAIKNVETGIDTITEVVRINGYVTDSSGSVWNALLGVDGLSDVWISHSDAGKYVGILTTKDMGDRTATIQLWYTKD